MPKIIAIKNEAGATVGHVGDIQFDITVGNAEITVTTHMRDGAFLKFIEINHEIGEDIYTINIKDLDTGTEKVLNKVVFISCSHPFKLGDLYIYQDAQIAFFEEMPCPTTK